MIKVGDTVWTVVNVIGSSSENLIECAAATFASEDKANLYVSQAELWFKDNPKPKVGSIFSRSEEDRDAMLAWRKTCPYDFFLGVSSSLWVYSSKVRD